jgi:glycosyltransferase involved in cell wall biosynthesis
MNAASPLRVSIVDQAGAHAGGAEETLFAFLRHRSEAVAPRTVLFEDGAFANRLRAADAAPEIVPVPAAIASARRERLPVRSALALPLMAERLARVLRDARTQVVYTNSMKAHLVGALAARRIGVPCVMYFHDLPDGLALQTLRFAARAASRSRMACSRVVRDCMDVGATTVVYPPIDLARFAALPGRAEARAKLGLAPDGPLVVLVGRINRWKGHDRFLRVAARVAARAPGARFAIVGEAVFRDADYVPELHALAGRLNLTDKLAFVPWVEDVADVYAAADVNVNCSTREPFGRAVTEAAACGVPTVCFDDSGAAETLDASTGRAVRAGDEVAMASAILAFLGDDALRAGAAAAARAGAARFDARVVAGEIEAVLHGAASA